MPWPLLRHSRWLHLALCLLRLRSTDIKTDEPMASRQSLVIVATNDPEGAGFVAIALGLAASSPTRSRTHRHHHVRAHFDACLSDADDALAAAVESSSRCCALRGSCACEFARISRTHARERARQIVQR